MWDKVITCVFAAIRAFYLALPCSITFYFLAKVFYGSIGFTGFGITYLIVFIPTWINSYIRISKIFKD
jgi:hypothetical protein